MKKFKEYFKPVQEKEELKEEVLEEAVYWQVLIPGISTPVFIEGPAKSGIKMELRTQLKPEAWKNLNITRITKPQIRKIYRDMAKDPEMYDDASDGVSEALEESTASYAKSLEKIARDRQLKMLSKSERQNLLKIAALLDKEKKEEVEFDEGIMDTAGFHNYPKRNKVGDEIEKIASKGGTDKFNLSKIASELQKGRIPHKFIKKLSPKGKKAVHDIMKDFGWKELPEDKEVNEVPIAPLALGAARIGGALLKGVGRGAGRIGTAGAGFGLGQAANAISKIPSSVGKAVAGGVAAGATKAAIDRHLSNKAKEKAKKDKEKKEESREPRIHMKAIDEKMADKYKAMNKAGDQIMKLAKKYKSFDLTSIASELRKGKIPKINKLKPNDFKEVGAIYDKLGLR